MGGHANSEEVSSRMPMKLKAKAGGHANSEKLPFCMPIKLIVKSGRACKIGRSFISYAHETNSQKWTGMQDHWTFLSYACAGFHFHITWRRPLCKSGQEQPSHLMPAAPPLASIFSLISHTFENPSPASSSAASRSAFSN